MGASHGLDAEPVNALKMPEIVGQQGRVVLQRRRSVKSSMKLSISNREWAGVSTRFGPTDSSAKEIMLIAMPCGASPTGGASASERVNHPVAVEEIAHELRVSVIARTAGTAAAPIRLLKRRVLVEVLLPAPRGALAQFASFFRFRGWTAAADHLTDSQELALVWHRPFLRARHAPSLLRQIRPSTATPSPPRAS